jgi:hypothetical protein
MFLTSWREPSKLLLWQRRKLGLTYLTFSQNE